MTTHHPGDVVGDHVLLSPVHVGGMGEVWHATGRGDRQEVAVKFLGEALGENGVARERLAREARNLAAVESRHVARMIALGPDHLVLEWIEGESLAEALLHRSTLPPAEVARLVGECADGLAAAHLAGVVHRDVKPSNIVLSERGAVLADFGISQGLGDHRLTDPGRVMGTAEYLAPERIRGAAASPPADVYALGACAFEALAGRPPFRAETPLRTAIAHVEEPVPSLPDGVPAFLRDLVTAMLAKDPAARPSALRAGAAARELLDPNTAPDGPDTLGRESSRSQQSSEEDQW